MSNTNIEDVMVQLTETRNELSEEDLRLWDGLENERVSRIAGDDANKSLTLQVQDSVSGTERRLSTEVIHREQGDLDKLGVLNQLSQSLSAYRIKTDKEIEAERFARDILGINLDARITTAEASFNHKELKLYQDIQEVFTDLDGKYTSMDARIKKYEDMLQDITMDSIKITMDNGEINMGAWTILSQAREWDLEILAKMRGFQEKTNEDVNQALEELQNQLPITENIINEIMENLSESPLISELRDALNESIDTSESLAVRLAKEEAARAQAMIDLAYANAQALAAEKAALAESLAAEAQARADEVQEEADRRIESIRQIRADLEQDVGELNNQVDSIRDGAIADKAGILETVNNYKTELKSDIATVNTELLGALDGVNTLVTEVRGENEVTLNELTTYKSSNDVAVAGLLSKVTTNISDTAANASKISGLTTELATTNTELGKVRNTSASALSKANTAVTANSALATRVDSLAAAITDLGEGAETTVDVYAFNALKAEVVTNSSGITSLVEQVDALGTSYTDLADGVEANTDAVSTLTVKQSEMNGDISQLSSDVTYLTSELGVTNAALNTKASNQALSNLNTKLETTDGLVAANTQQLTQLNTDLTTVRDGLETKASTEALNNLATDVTELEGGLAVNASAITSLKSEIDTELNKKATVTAVNGLTTKVEEVEGKTTTNANSILALNTSVGNVVNGLANKLDSSAIANYYTKSQTDAKADSVAAGKVEDFKATLGGSGVNLFSYDMSVLNSSNSTWGGVGFTIRSEPGLGLTTGDRAYIVTAAGSANDYVYSGRSGWLSPSEPGAEYIVSLYIKSPTAKPVRIRQLGFNASGSAGLGTKMVDVALEADVWTRISIRYTAMAYHEYIGWCVYHNRDGAPASDNNYVLISRPMAERAFGTSDKPSNWVEGGGVSNQVNANSTAIQTTNAEVSRVDDRVTATNSAQTLLEGRVEDVEGDISKKADASALASLTTRVGTVEGQYTSQASDITKLNNSLDTTNVNVGTAQTAAQNAMNAAGAKGKVIFGSSAPAVADRLVQNLWIDTTGNANTPKRWNGSAWVVVTDKVATDAAKAVSDLDTVVKTKADVSALNSLTTKVTDDAKKTTANTNSITELNSDIVKINNDLATKANASALSDMYTKNEVDDKATEIAAGQLDKFSASLKSDIADNIIIGGNSRKVRTPGSYLVASWRLKEPLSEGTVVTLRYKITYKRAVGDTVTRLTPYFQGTYSQGISAHAITSDVSSSVHEIEAVVGAGQTAANFAFYLLTSEQATGVGYSTEVVIDWVEGYVGTNTKLNTLGDTIDANATAIQTTNAEVSRVDDRVTTESNRITTLAGRVSTAENGLALKADAAALNDIYTKNQTDAKATEIAAGEVAKYDAKLTIGGSNLYFGPNPVYLRSQTSAGRVVFAATASGNTQRFDYLSDDNLDLSGLQVGDPTIASIEVLVPSTDTSDYTIQFGTYRFSGSSYVYAPTVDVKTLPKDTWVKLTTAPGTYTSGQPATGINLVFNMVGRKTAGDEIQWRNFMMEKATTASSFVESDKVTQAKLDANATAISNTIAEVTRIDGQVTSSSEDITGLKNRMTTAEGSKADVSALNRLTTRVGDVEGGLSTQASNTTALEAKIDSRSNEFSLAHDYDTKNPADWESHYSDRDLSVHFKTITGGKIGNNVFRKDTTHESTNYNYNLASVPNDRAYRLSMWVRCSSNATGIVGFNYKYTTDASPEFTSLYSSVSSVSIAKNGTWQLLTVIADLRTSAFNRLRFGFYTGHTGSAGWWEMQGFKVEAVVSVDDADSTLATAKALTTTNTEISRINDVVKGHVTDIRDLTTNIAGKADSSALNALTVRVEDEAGKTSTQASDITNLTSSLSDTNKIAKDALPKIGGSGSFKTFKEVLNYYHASSSSSANIVIETPITYTANMFRISGKGYNYASTKSVIDFDVSGYAYQSTGTILQHGAKNNGTFPMRIRLGMKNGKLCVILSPKGTNFAYPAFTVDATVSYGSVSDVYQTGWTSSQVAEANLASSGITAIIEPSLLDVATEVTANASAVSNLTTQVEDIDGIVTSQAEQLLVLTSDNKDNKNALSVQAKVVDGVKANYMVKMETNGVIGGFGLMQSTGVLGSVKTSFGVNANSFFIGAPASKKQPFIVTTTNQVVNGVKYPAGTYIDVALIANATIGTAKITDLAVTGAKIANATIGNAKITDLNASKINAGFISAARIEAGSITANKIDASVFKSVGTDGSSSTISGGTIRAYYPNGKIAFHIGVS